jgi:hypothetical protein
MPKNRRFHLGTQLALVSSPVNIRFTSSLTPEDENMLAPALLNAMSGILDLLPIAYMIRIDTSDAQVYQHTGSGGRLDPVSREVDSEPSHVPLERSES